MTVRNAPGVHIVKRRTFLQFIAAGGVVGFSGCAADPLPLAIRAIIPRPPGPLPSLTVLLRRPTDQLALMFEFFNLEVDDSGAEPVLVRKNVNLPAFVVAVFPPQHIMEEAFYETANANELPDGEPPQPQLQPPYPPPVGARVAGPSRLAFEIPDDVESVPFTEAGLLNWSAWEPSVVPSARVPFPIVGLPRPAQRPFLRRPMATETALELPWWLLISPHVQTGWLHTDQAKTIGDRTELWHTRMAGRAPSGEPDETDTARMAIRAIWAVDPGFSLYYTSGGIVNQPVDGEDFAFNVTGMPFRTALSPRDRYDLIVSTSDYRARIADTGYAPVPAEVNRLMLSSMGGWLDVRCAWRAEPVAAGSGTSLESWRHIGTMGRDHYVRIVRRGFLFPFGHAASLIKVTERKFRTITVGSGGRQVKRRVAYNFQRYFIVVRKPEVSYGGEFQPDGGRGFPFTQARITTLITPTLDPPMGQSDIPGGFSSNTLAFVPRIGTDPFRFHMVGTDRTGRTVDIDAPVVFVDGTIATDDLSNSLLDWYNTDLDVDDDERSFDVHGQPVAVAPVADGEPRGATDLEIHRFTLGATPPIIGTTPAELENAQQPAFFPLLAEAEIRLAAAEAAAGDGLGSLPVVVMDPHYVTSDFPGAGKGEVFVRLKDTDNPAFLDFGGKQAGDRSGAVATPNLGITALSRKAGTIAGSPDTFQAGEFNPADFFGSLNATLLGDISLKNVIQAVTGSEFDLTDPSKRDRMLMLNTREVGDDIVTELRWRPKLQDFLVFVAELEGVGPASLDLLVEIRTPRSAPDKSSMSVLGELRNFEISLLTGSPFLRVLFDRLRFQASGDAKPDVDVEIREVVFQGPLEFVNQLKDYLTFSSGGFSITLAPTHLSAGFQIPLPAITVGVFALQNITFAAGTTIPFTGQPVRFRFGFSTMDNPFLLSVMIFGGGGFFELGIGPDGVESFQASLEFGVVAAIDFGVASGSISITAGIYFAIGVQNPPDNPDGKPELTGFLKLKGQAEVLGIITVTLLMKASITYIPDTKKGIARAIVVVEIDLLIFSGSVEVEYEKKFGGSSDPFFDAQLSQSEWDTYADAFAPIGA